MDEKKVKRALSSREKKQFFEGISVYCNSTSIETIKPVYYATIKHIVTMIAKEGVIRCPEFGNFELKKRGGKVMWSIHHKRKVYMSPVFVVIFKPFMQLKEYINTRVSQRVGEELIKKREQENIKVIKRNKRNDLL